MSPESRSASSSSVVAALILAVGIVFGGWLLGGQIKAMRLGDRYITVRGLVERQVKADLAIWPLTFQETGDDLTSVTGRASSDKDIILSFFKDQGFQPEEVEVGVINVDDTSTNLYGNNRPPHRFIVKQTLTLSTQKVDQAAAASQKTLELLQKGIVLASAQQYGSSGGVQYVFNGLNQIKPDMITEATRNARAAADRFAADSGSRVGVIRTAQQGVFSISAANGGSTTGEENGGSGSDTSSLMKKVRVVTTVEYYLQQ